MKKMVLLFLLAPELVFAWAGRGHDTLCQAAVFLVQEPELKHFLAGKPHIMGHLCNIPDIQWRDLPKEETKLGNPTHYIDMDLISSNYKDVGLEYKSVVKTYAKSNGRPLGEVIEDLGSNWWRADQFYRRAVVSGKAGDINGFVINLGIMGHFVGDNAQPLHVTKNHDGEFNGHGGIHRYYEDDIVAALPENLQARVVAEGKRLQLLAKKNKPSLDTEFLKPGSVVEKMRALGGASFADVDLLMKEDKVLVPSNNKEERGMKLHRFAERKPAEENVKLFEGHITKHMGRGAALLAQLWEQAYNDAGKPDLKSYSGNRFPLTVDFVAPDYLPSN